VLIFDSARGWPEDVRAAIRSGAVPARTGTVALAFDDLPPGSYAAVVLHDEDADRKLDRNWAGIPREGWGMSNNPKARMSAPDFSRARFTLRGNTRLRVHLNYY
jgi:uncharacterized protein (DUF2141 family)